MKTPTSWRQIYTLAADVLRLRRLVAMAESELARRESRAQECIQQWESEGGR